MPPGDPKFRIRKFLEEGMSDPSPSTAYFSLRSWLPFSDFWIDNTDAQSGRKYNPTTYTFSGVARRGWCLESLDPLLLLCQIGVFLILAPTPTPPPLLVKTEPLPWTQGSLNHYIHPRCLKHPRHHSLRIISNRTFFKIHTFFFAHRALISLSYVAVLLAVH